MSDYVICCEKLTKVYGGGTVALKDLDLRLEKGGIHVIIGPNGAGKSTFLRIASTEMARTTGGINVLGMDPEKDQAKITPRIGVMPQQALLYKQLTVWEHVYYFTLLKGLSRRESRKETEWVLDLLDLTDRKQQELNTLSGGLLNTVNLAQAITGNPELLFLDEPTTGIDPRRRKVILDYIRAGKGKRTVILTTQYLDEAYELADNLVIFHKGHLVYEGDIRGALQRLGYELKIELPLDDLNRETAMKLEKQFYREQDNKIWLWVKDSKKILRELIESNIDPTTIVIHRPMLEEAYLNILENIGGNDNHH